jgi:hypothetical protein
VERADEKSSLPSETENRKRGKSETEERRARSARADTVGGWFAVRFTSILAPSTAPHHFVSPCLSLSLPALSLSTLAILFSAPAPAL